MGWATEYRQLEPGSFSSNISVQEGDDWFFIEEQSGINVEVQAPAPDGMYVVALAEGQPIVVNGQIMSSDHIFFQPPGSDLRAIVPARTRVTQLGIMGEQFEDLVQTVAPGLSLPCASVKTIATNPGRLESVRRAMRAILCAPSSLKDTRKDMVMTSLSDTITVLNDHAGKVRSGRSLHLPAARRILDRAREYIEAHLHETIQVTSICRYTGANPRSLERIFAREMGVSPQQYVKARRFNAVHRHLIAADMEQGISVTDVALNHGFSHLGRFAREYRRYFGKSPRETLRSP